MKPLAATLIFAFGVFHALPGLPWLTQPRDPAAPEDQLILRVPRWARVGWLLASLVVIAGAVVLAVDGWAGVAVAGVGMADVCALAVANGFWMKGRPTVSHHATRISIAVAILALAAFSL